MVTTQVAVEQKIGKQAVASKIDADLLHCDSDAEGSKEKDEVYEWLKDDVVDDGLHAREVRKLSII